MKFLFSVLGLIASALVGHAIAWVSITLAALVGGFGCVVGLELGTRFALRKVDPDVSAHMRPSPFAYGWVMGIATVLTLFVIPAIPFSGLVGQTVSPELALWRLLMEELGFWGSMGIVILYLPVLAILGAILGGRFGLKMHRRATTSDHP